MGWEALSHASALSHITDQVMNLTTGMRRRVRQALVMGNESAQAIEIALCPQSCCHACKHVSHLPRLSAVSTA